MIKLQGAFWGRGKCPLCERKYQKDIRLIWLWDTEKKKIIKNSMIKFCSWCFIIMVSDAIKMNIPFAEKIEWGNKKKFKNQCVEADVPFF